MFGQAFDRKLAADFLTVAAKSPGTAAPGHAARLTLARFNCTGCHERNGEGGLRTELLAKLTVNQTEQNAESVTPPPLTGVADKLQSKYLVQVLEDGRRSRPWMSLKMPQFAKEAVHDLPAGLAAIDGDVLETKPFRPKSDPVMAEAGRRWSERRGSVA